MTVTPPVPPVADNVDSSGKDGEPKDQSKDSVSYETHRRLLAEKKAATERLAVLEAEKKAREDKELADKGEFQKLLEKEREEKAALKADLDARTLRDQKAMKIAAVYKALGGKIDRKWLSQVDYDQINIDPDTGEVEASGVTKAADALKKEWPEAFVDPNTPRIPSDAPKGSGSNTISRAEWLKLPAKEMQKWKLSQIVD